ncbi:hypothetical protein Golomagni_02513 [Golovinomyces magnicellulatus]|nr:hypothetical protein Golomagni_02513 [Golovinomyces magnicellulatus]
MAQPPVTRMPTLNLPPFDGDGQNADRWLAMLKLDFGAGNIDSETYPQLWLNAIYTKVAGKAEDWMDRTLKIKNIMATRQTATITEVQIFEAEFRSRFSGRVAITQQASPFLYAQSLKQEPHENLTAYIYRARELRSSAGGRRTTQMEPMYDMGCQVIAIENGAMGVTDLEEAISKMNAAVQTLQHIYLYGPQASIAWKALAETQQPQEYLQVSAVNQHNLTPPKPAAQIFPLSLTSNFRNDYYSRSNRPQSSAPPNFQIAQLHHNVSHPVISGQLLQLPQGNNMPQQQPRYEGPPRSSSGYTGNLPLPTKRELPQGYNPLLSRHPVVNGTILFRQHCFKCGELGHPSRDCPTPQALTCEEQTMLYNRYVDRVLASTQRQINSSDAYQFVSPVPRVAGINVQNNEENYGNYPTQTYEEATGQMETYSFRAGEDAVDSLEFRAQLMDEERQICQAPCLSDKIEEEVVQSLPAEVVYDSLDGSAAWGLVSAELDILNLSGSLEHLCFVVGEDGRRSAKDILEEAHAEVAEVEASRKRRHVEFDKFSTEVPEDNHHFNCNGSRIHPKIKRGSLKPINGRRGEAPRENEKRGRKKGTAPVEVRKLDYQPERSKRRELPKLKGTPKEARPFRLNTACVISNQQTRVTFQSGTVQADQGSDLNLISNSLVKDLKLERRTDGSITPLKDFAVLVVGVGHVFQKIHAFIQPEIPGQPDSTNLLLRLPWPYSVNAILAIRDFTITVGDLGSNQFKDKERVKIQTPRWEPHPDHQLLLRPSDPEVLLRANKLKRIKEDYTSSDTSSDSSDYSSDDQKN